MAIKKEKARVVAIIPKGVEQQIKELAEQEKRSVSAMTAILIEKGLEEYKNI